MIADKALAFLFHIELSDGRLFYLIPRFFVLDSCLAAIAAIQRRRSRNLIQLSDLILLLFTRLNSNRRVFLMRPHAARDGAGGAYTNEHTGDRADSVESS